jgi:dihydropteroate synthase
LGTSRKSTLGLVLGEPDPLRRGAGNDVTAAWGVAQGCSMVRVHDVAAIRPVIRMADALRRGALPA